MGGMLRGWRAFAVSGVQLWSQLMAITWATGSNTLNCFKQAQKAPVSMSGRHVADDRASGELGKEGAMRSL